MQTNYMASFMVQEIRENDDRHGFVTDANHSFFSSDKKYLFVTVTFSVMHGGWVPVFLAYSGAQTGEDYRVYFFELFKSMHRWFGTVSDITDDDYAQVVDFRRKWLGLLMPLLIGSLRFVGYLPTTSMIRLVPLTGIII